MKTKFCPMLLRLGVALTAWPLLRAEEAGKPPLSDEEKAPGHGEYHMFMRHGMPRELETVAFLGVETVPVSPELTAQLGLARDSGLVVRHIVPSSPAASVLQPLDILLKLDDQILIEPRQFAVLVRNHKEGDEIELTYVRGGKQGVVKVKLGKHEAPKFAHVVLRDGNELFARLDDPDRRATSREEMVRVLSLLDREHPDAPGRRLAPPPLPPAGSSGFRAISVNPENSNMVYNDSEGSLELTLKNGAKTLVAKDPKGASLFSGAIDSPEQRKALPPSVRERLEKLEGMHDFSFRFRPNFEPDDERVLLDEPTSISMPRSTTAPGPSPEI